MKNNTTELVFILDRSGSMQGLESDTIGGFNSMIEKQRKDAGKAYINTYLFDDISEVLHDRVEISDIQPMTSDDYTVRGMTALFDAIGGAIEHISSIHKALNDEDVPSRTMFIIITDGQENASRKYGCDEIKKKIEVLKQDNGWEFLFIGANIDAIGTASMFGIDSNRAVNYRADDVGTSIIYDTISATISELRAGEDISDDWSKSITEDFETRS